MVGLAQQVGDAAGLVGLLLALDTLFTAEQARRLEDERLRQGGARKNALRRTRWVAGALAAVTTAAILMLLPLIADVLGTIGGETWEPVLGVFVLTWLLLLGLLVWQALLVARAK